MSNYDATGFMSSAAQGSGNTVLLVAFHFPPQSGSSGLLRSLKFSRYLPEFAWRPVVLAANPRAYESTDPQKQKDASGSAPIIRAFALDTKRHLGFRGAYLDWMAFPDRWVSWVIGAVPRGFFAIRKYQVDVIFSTFPISTAILIGFFLHLLTGKPWVADFRDSMTEAGYHKDPTERKVRIWIERNAVRHASRIIFTADSTRRMYLDRYPELPSEKCIVISNGYDEEDFAALREHSPASIPPEQPVRLLHTGLVYPEERDPRPFFKALARRKQEGRINAATLRIIFRAAGSEDLFREMIDTLGIADLIELLPHVPYHQALQECADADGLLLFQAANCDHQIPAKAYEYLRLRKPLFALTSYTGDTAALLTEVGGSTIVNLADENEIYQALPPFLTALRTATHPLADPDKLRKYARRSQARQLADCLNGIKYPAPVLTQAKSVVHSIGG
jgi:glycosyltransferase involved in cell wall biosynthesis